MTQLDLDVSSFAAYADQFKRYSPETVIGALVLKLVQGDSVITDEEGTITGVATEVKQDALIEKIALLIGEGGILQPPLAKNATDSFSEAIAATATALKWNITNLSNTDELYYCLNAEADLLNSRILLPFQSVWSDNLAEARSRVTVIAKNSILINYSVQLITSS